MTEAFPNNADVCAVSGRKINRFESAGRGNPILVQCYDNHTNILSEASFIKSCDVAFKVN